MPKYIFHLSLSNSIWLLLLSFVSIPAVSHSQTLYKYTDKSGIVTFTSKKPVGKKYSLVSTDKLSKSVIISGNSSGIKNTKINKTKYDNDIKFLAKEYRLDPALIKAIIHIESAFNPYAVSPAGARGLMQLMPATARRFGVKNSYDSYDNMHGGVQYLRWLFDRYNGNIRLVLAAYNAGEGRVETYKGIPPFKETQNYVKNVIKVADLYKKDFKGTIKNNSKYPLIRTRLAPEPR